MILPAVAVRQPLSTRSQPTLPKGIHLQSIRRPPLITRCSTEAKETKKETVQICEALKKIKEGDLPSNGADNQTQEGDNPKKDGCDTPFAAGNENVESEGVFRADPRLLV